MKKSKKQLLQEIKEQLKNSGASAGEICTELLRLEKASAEGLRYYLDGLKQEEFIGNAKIIDINELPKINDKHELINGLICIEIKIVDFKEDYIIYRVTFCEEESLHILDGWFVDCSSWLYAVKKTENK